jgi:hypothetical protein
VLDCPETGHSVELTGPDDLGDPCLKLRMRDIRSKPIIREDFLSQLLGFRWLNEYPDTVFWYWLNLARNLDAELIDAPPLTKGYIAYAFICIVVISCEFCHMPSVMQSALLSVLDRSLMRNQTFSEMGAKGKFPCLKFEKKSAVSLLWGDGLESLELPQYQRKLLPVCGQ